ncbi:site-specific DNA-methyltransferase [Mycoplasma sp. Z1473D]
MNNDKKQIILDWLKEQEDTETLTQKQRDVYALIRESLHSKKYGLVFEEKEEDIVNKTNDSILTLEKKDSIIVDANKKLNYLIEGDNYQSLKLLLKTHRNRIDVIYIDPPYNTGNKDFVYNDQYVDSEDTFRHSKWLSFMKKRLEMAKELLSEKGVIFISIDDNEQAQLKLLCDEVFGENNFISILPRVTVKGGKTQVSHFTSNHDLIICYAKNKLLSKISKQLVVDKAFNKMDEFFDARGMYHTKQSLDSNSLGYVKSLDYPIEYEGKTYYPGGYELYCERQNGNVTTDNCYRWTWSKDLTDFAINNGFISIRNERIWPKKYMLCSIEKDEKGYFIKYSERTKPFSDLEFLDNKYSNSNGNRDLEKVLEGKKFSMPKPVELISKIISISSDNKESVILDFFAGSGTTGHAVAKLNAEDGGDRTYILCTNNENNICEDVTFKRLSNIQEELPHNLIYQKVNSINKSDFIYSYYGKEYLDQLDVSSLQLAQLQLGKLIDNKELLYFENQEEFNNYSVDDLLNAKFIFINENKIDLNECEVYDQIQNKVISIPDAYYEKELKEVGYLW